MNEEWQLNTTNKVFRPYGNLPTSDDFDLIGYTNALSDNMLGPMRQFRAAVLDIISVAISDPEQRRRVRSRIHDKFHEMERKHRDWVTFYGLDDIRVLDTVYELVEEYRDSCTRP